MAISHRLTPIDTGQSYFYNSSFHLLKKATRRRPNSGRSKSRTPQLREIILLHIRIRVGCLNLNCKVWALQIRRVKNVKEFRCIVFYFYGKRKKPSLREAYGTERDCDAKRLPESGNKFLSGSSCINEGSLYGLAPDSFGLQSSPNSHDCHFRFHAQNITVLKNGGARRCKSSKYFLLWWAPA